MPQESSRVKAFVKLSGDLIDRPDVLEWLKRLADEYYVAISIGGGSQINTEFGARELPIKFCAMGRETNTHEEKQLARDVLENNADEIEDRLHAAGIKAHVEIPVRKIGSVLCHENGEIAWLAAYNGFNQVFILTLKSRIKSKKKMVKDFGKVFARHVGKDPSQQLTKVKIIGFPD